MFVCVHVCMCHMTMLRSAPTHESLVIAGKSEGEPAQLSAPRIPLVARAVPQSDRWQELQEDYVRGGWVSVLEFVKDLDKCKPALPKNATENVMKRLSAHGCALQADDEHTGRGRPHKMAKICDLKRLHPEWK